MEVPVQVRGMFPATAAAESWHDKERRHQESGGFKTSAAAHGPSVGASGRREVELLFIYAACVDIKNIKNRCVSAHAGSLRFIKAPLLQLFPTPKFRIFISLYILFFGRNEEFE